jgi:hypothetical protein
MEALVARRRTCTGSGASSRGPRKRGARCSTVSRPRSSPRGRPGGDFALHWTAHGLSYGVPAQRGDVLDTGRDALVNLSRGVLGKAARQFETFHVLHVTARPEVLAERLAARGRETPQEIARRLARPAPPFPAGLRVTRSTIPGVWRRRSRPRWPRSTPKGCSGGPRGTAPGVLAHQAEAADGPGPGIARNAGRGRRAPCRRRLGQAPREGQVKAELLHHVGIAPAQSSASCRSERRALRRRASSASDGGARKASSARPSRRRDRRAPRWVRMGRWR